MSEDAMNVRLEAKEVKDKLSSGIGELEGD